MTDPKHTSSTDLGAGCARLRILLADDSRLMRALLSRLLQDFGHAVVPVTTGGEALEVTASQQFDLILMDLEMPVMDGIEATLAIRGRDVNAGRRTPIIAMTAHGDCAESRERCEVAGMDGYITKPVEAGALAALLERITNWGDSKLK